MVLKKENYIFTAVTTWGWTDETLMAAILGFLPDDKESHMIGGSEARILWSKTKLSNDIYYSAIDASVRIHELSDELDFTVTNYGDIIIYRTINCNFTPQEVLDSYNRYISSRFFVREEKKEDNKMTIEANKYIYIASNTIGSSDDQLISALLGYVPTCTKYEMIHGCALLWSRTKFLHERSFDLTDAKRRLRERDEKLDIVRTSYGDTIIYRDVNNEVLRILDAYYEYSKKDEPHMIDSKKYVYDRNRRLNIDSHVSLNCQPILTMPRNLGRSAAMSMLNSIYGLNGGLNYKKPPFNFKLIFGQEHATGRYKTICLWEDGEKTIICGDNKVTKLPVAQAFAWCYVKRTFRSVSQFKKHVDKRTTKMDGVWYFEGDCLLDEYAQGSVPGSSKKRDIYDAAALAIASKRYGGLRKLVDEYINKKENK